MRINICVSLKGNVVFCGLISVNFVYDQWAQYCALVLCLGLQRRLLRKLGSVCDPHRLVGLHRDRVRCLYPHSDSIEQTLLSQLGSERDLYFFLRPCLVRSGQNHAQGVAHVWNLDVLRCY